MFASFPDEVRRLRERLEDREKERERTQDMDREKVPVVEMRLEQWKREVGCELSALRGRIDRATSLGNREERSVALGESMRIAKDTGGFFSDYDGI